MIEGEARQGLPGAQFCSLLTVLGQRGFGVIDAGSYDAARGGLVVNVFKLEDGCLVVLETIFFPEEGHEYALHLQHKVFGIAAVEGIVGE